ncbi:c-type cytochrome [Bradyrhizobium sp. ORS 111]|uniref:c-type cytochrome n=1 Tax=Bradyrhizobium sp. ORS 111 TaxID=1685958 RepID=UPI00388E6E3F
MAIAVALWRLHARSAPPVTLNVIGTTAQIQRGREISNGFCSGCHSTKGTLTGGLNLAVNFPVRFGSLIASNLTPAGALGRWSDGDVFRNGVDPDGRWLIMMSYTNAGKLSDADTAAVIAYLRSLPAAGRRTPEPADRLNLLGFAMLGTGLLSAGKPIITGVVTAPAKAPSVQFGKYILSYQDCREYTEESPPGARQVSFLRSAPICVSRRARTLKSLSKPFAPASTLMATLSAKTCRGSRSVE